MVSTVLTYISTELTSIAQQLRQNTVKVRINNESAGSGVILRSDGVIITNAHVATSKRAVVELWDGRVVEAVRTKIDPTVDLATLQITVDNLDAAIIGNVSNLRVGELVLAVGNPFGDTGVVTVGMVSCLVPYINKSVQKTYSSVLADITLHPGNSGGLLADCYGRVIGINTMIVYGAAVAIPVSTVENFLNSAAEVI
ncbi:peptidase S1 and S6 chymotrypsin/Hap [Calothrix sp. NIES-4071]|nr:peptidase S1 and S6 chymotrypsin/Hap [Calothrix sp. NIES-4071]BAZ59420.1 peptidase S1 and S6 chymotrypsin/Hap [Calothrix sp. NIES-4105]